MFDVNTFTENENRKSIKKRFKYPQKHTIEKDQTSYYNGTKCYKMLQKNNKTRFFIYIDKKNFLLSLMRKEIPRNNSSL